jgi:hypothetical protein
MSSVPAFSTKDAELLPSAQKFNAGCDKYKDLFGLNNEELHIPHQEADT